MVQGGTVKGPPARHPEEPKEQLPAVEGTIANATELKPGDRVVYPNQGVCAVVGLEQKDIAGQALQFVRMRREEDGAAVLVPMNKVPSVGLRRVASAEQIEGVFHYLAAQFDDPELDWKVRHRDNADRLIAGGVLGVAEVVKGLHSLSRIRPLPTKEREQYDNARHLLVNEIAVSLTVPPVLAEDYVDYALMPPAGTKFELKPPPKPVLLPARPRRRIAQAEEAEEDLGLADLGVDLGNVEIDASIADGEGGGDGAEAAGEEAHREEGAAEGAEVEAKHEEEAGEPASPGRRGRAAPAAPERGEKAAKPAKAAAKKPAAKKAEKPEKAKKPAKRAEKPPKAAAKKPARGGKKK
jgi:RNA polymerase-interacting CarD/CdnL/TRCF family regulator